MSYTSMLKTGKHKGALPLLSDIRTSGPSEMAAVSW